MIRKQPSRAVNKVVNQSLVKRKAVQAGNKAPLVSNVKKVRETSQLITITSKPTGEVPKEIQPISQEQLIEMAWNQARYDVIQSSKNITRPMDTKTNRPVPSYEPFRRKGHDALGYAKVYQKASLANGNDPIWAATYAEGIEFWREQLSADLVIEKVEYNQILPDNLVKKYGDRISNQALYGVETETGSHYFRSAEEREAWLKKTNQSPITRENGAASVWDTIGTQTLDENDDPLKPNELKETRFSLEDTRAKRSQASSNVDLGEWGKKEIPTHEMNVTQRTPITPEFNGREAYLQSQAWNRKAVSK